jgi:hypothetical protein
MNKKALIILGTIFLLIVGTLGYIVYSRYQTGADAVSPNPDVGNNQTQNPPASPPPAPLERFVRLNDEVIVSPALLYNGSGITYFDTIGQVYVEDFLDEGGAVSLDRKRKLDYPVKANIESVTWPLSGPNYITRVRGEDRLSFSVFDVSKKEYADLAPQVKSVDFMPEGDKLLYVWEENGKSTLNISDLDGSNWKEISEMWENGNAISISPDGTNILYYQTNNKDSADNAINVTTPDGKVWQSLVKEGYNFGTLWSPDGKKFLFARKDKASQEYQLWYYDLLNREAKNLELYTTTGKAVWDSNSRYVYAAVPRTGNLEENQLSKDVFYRLDLETEGFDKRDYEPAAEIDGRDLSVNGNGTKLFFKNAQDGKLYYLDLVE